MSEPVGSLPWCYFDKEKEKTKMHWVRDDEPTNIAINYVNK